MIKGYIVSFGYMGFINGVYELFATEGDYLDSICCLLAQEIKKG